MLKNCCQVHKICFSAKVEHGHGRFCNKLIRIISITRRTHDKECRRISARQFLYDTNEILLRPSFQLKGAFDAKCYLFIGKRQAFQQFFRLAMIFFFNSCKYRIRMFLNSGKTSDNLLIRLCLQCILQVVCDGNRMRIEPRHTTRLVIKDTFGTHAHGDTSQKAKQGRTQFTIKRNR